MAFKHQTDQLPPSIASKFLEQICFRNSLFTHNLKVWKVFCLLRTLAGNVKIITTENWFIINYFNFLSFGNGNLLFCSSIPKPHLIGNLALLEINICTCMWNIFPKWAFSFVWRALLFRFLHWTSQALDGNAMSNVVRYNDFSGQPSVHVYTTRSVQLGLGNLCVIFDTSS